MKVSWLKSNDDKKSFKLFKGLGFDVFDVEDLEKTDSKINELVKLKYDTIVISNEVAGFSEDIIKKYNKSDKINIFII